MKDLGPGFPKIEKRQAGSFWMEGVSHGAVAIGGSAGYQAFRNVKDFGAIGDGKTDDTAAINLVISSGDRCAENCGSSTVKPALVYFPSGTYLVSKSVIGYYNTQLVGSVRNFIIDMRAVPNVLNGQSVRPAGIHWQVAQATSLQNIQIVMSSREESTHMGIFMENGSGGFMSNVSFSGGAIGAYLGNQQFTIRKFSFSGCKVAVETHWNWVFIAKSFLIENCQVAFNISPSTGNGQGTGSMTIMDTSILNTGIGVITKLAGVNRTSLILDNVKLINTPVGVSDDDKTMLAGGSTWGAVLPGDVQKPADLLDENRNWFEKSKPQYQNVPASGFYDVKVTGGARGNGQSDDTAAINAVLQAATSAGKIAYFPHGIYVVTNTIFVPQGAKIVGEVWSQIQASGGKFGDIANPHVVVKVGNAGDVGTVEIQDVIFGVRGPTPGAIMMEWNIKASDKGAAGIWDAHWMIGRRIGSNLQAAQCPKMTGKVNPNYIAGSLLLHITPNSSGYFENVWVWTADHDLDVASQEQIDIYVGQRPYVWTEPLPWNWPVQNLRPDNEGPPRPSHNPNAPPRKRGAPAYPEPSYSLHPRATKKYHIDPREGAEQAWDKARREAEESLEEQEVSMLALENAPIHPHARPPTIPDIEKRQYSDGAFIFERADYGSDCLETLYALWRNSSLCEPFNTVFSPSYYEKIDGGGYNDFFG
ncbi:hypothetical protein TWF694_010057 [Orbilia ellipsospora]|uniref:Rhamnogalacturonase A/B/Epimerase-like pectate lyase domain-containing protein n=1 Tax=Orbilia ellipsospora TaxID=2528407 RepID=A0AAV9X9R2_9PEZI